MYKKMNHFIFDHPMFADMCFLSACLVTLASVIAAITALMVRKK